MASQVSAGRTLLGWAKSSAFLSVLIALFSCLSGLAEGNIFDQFFPFPGGGDYYDQYFPDPYGPGPYNQGPYGPGPYNPGPYVPPDYYTPNGGRPKACECGRSSQSRIYDGYGVREGQAPWMARLVSVSGNSVTQCGATIISPQYALTAGHCIPSDKNAKSFLSFGTKGFSNSYNSDTRYPVEKFFSKYTNKARGTDIAVAKLSKSVNVVPICLPPRGNNDFAGYKATMIGYGKTNGAKSADRLLAADITVPSNAQCKRVQSINSNEICGGNYGSEPAFCDGDSGGPMVTTDSRTRRLEIIGVVHGSYGCTDKKTYGIFTRVSNYVPWIQEVTGNAGCQL